ncbi:hypothetical protein [Nitrosopumilus ureiphilus]|uniref:Uncharacterized protein n=1 Tax=Nitrosopumilus ureiphilus TaxID=1470067 RepID=A0A7D5R369_9ARCH|nr:hypothetical protein [Nitrosopumilus ureiphilus]QLH06780.1 hypothetical protein C5F50_06590 [Nitrosopumilus ureiphilus]
MEEKDNSIIFRSYGFENDDRCKTIVKIESDYMDRLGIKEGDIVKVTGKDSAMAFCFSLNQEELEKAESQDLPIEYLNPDHEEIEYPRVIMSSPVHCNACPSGRLRLIKLEKLSTSDFKNQIPEANIVTFGTMKFAENAMPGYKDNIDFSSLFGQIVKKQERVNTSFFPDFAQKHQRTSRGGRSHPPNFSSIIINVKPEDHNFWLVTKNTKFEFQDIPMDEFKGKATKPEALSFLKTIPIPHKFHVLDTEIVFTSLEVFENTMKLRWYSFQRIKLPENIFSNPSKANEITMQMSHESAELTIEIRDDLGNVYADGLSIGGGGSSGPDPTTNEMILDHSGEYRFHSTLNPKAKEISIIVKEIMWIKRNRRDMPTPTTPPNMGQMTESHPTLSVLEGPWEFKIIL